MNRTLLIARREYVAYAKTVGFWLSLLALPLFAVLGGGIPLLIRSAEPIKTVAVIEQGPGATGLAATVRDALQADLDRQSERLRLAAEKGQAGAGRAMASISAPKIRLIAAPPAIADATGPARDAAIKTALDKQTPEAQRLDAVVFLDRIDGKPAAQVWTARATDNEVSSFVRDALRDARRSELLKAAGVPPAVATEIQTFRPEVKAFSPNAASGAEVSMRDRIPSFVGLGAGFLLWSLVITGASILLNSVMEEKSNKILEVLLSSASATEILTGKVLGVALLTLTVLVAWGGLGGGALIAAAPDMARDIGSVLLNDGLLIYFLLFMVGGYLMYAVLFAAIGAFCETPRDAQTLMGPIMMVLFVPLIVMQLAIRTPDAPVVQIMSLIPPFTPFVMAARAPSGPPLVEIVGAMIGMFLFAALMVWVAGRAFRAGALSDVKLNWKSFLGAVRGGN